MCPHVFYQYSADLVPVFSFGENDIFQQVDNAPGSMVRRWQQFFLRHVGFAPCMPYGRGIFNYDFGVLPVRHPIVTVVGKPIRVDQAHDHPTDALIDEYHEKYVTALQDLYDRYKDKYLKDRERDLQIVR